MSVALSNPTNTVVAAPLTEDQIRRRLEGCPKLASLQSINKALGELVNSEQSLNSQIAEIIRRDPSLASRVLRLVNSVYFGLSVTINNIEEAVFFLGLRQLRELAMATPVIEELNNLESVASSPLPWKDLWSHSISTGILTREILATTLDSRDDDTDYLVGLLHNVGKIVMAYAFPQELTTVVGQSLETPADVCRLERELIGWDHAQIGAYYLERHRLAEEITFAVRYHNEPEKAPRHSRFAAAVQVADYLVRHAGVPGGFENIQPIADEAWVQLSGWKILYGADDTDTRLARASLANVLQRLPQVLGSLF